jgi:hypothetical protein
MSMGKCALGLAGVVLLAGCSSGSAGPHDIVTAADRSRLAVMQADPVFDTAVAGGANQVIVGEQVDKGSYRRGYVLHTIYTKSTPGIVRPPAVQAFVRGVLQGMQSRGWVLYWAQCQGGSEPAGWANTVLAYRISDGVSYWAFLQSVVSQRTPDNTSGTSYDYMSFVNATLIAPEAAEPGNLFPDHPPAVPLASICASQPVLNQQPIFQGTYIDVAADNGHSGQR